MIGASRAEIREQVPATLRLVGLSTKLHSYPDQLSGGEQQRVSVARAFVNHPPLLLADEPSGNLDPVTSIGIMQLLYRINKTGTTVLVVTHDREMVDNMQPPRGRALRGPRRPRRGLRRLHRGVDHRVRAADAGRDGRRPRGRQTNGHGHERLLDVEPVFFFQEAFRALRRNGAPTLAAIVTTVVTVVLLGVLIPIFQTTQAKSDEVRGELNFQVGSSTTRPRPNSRPAREARRRSRTSPQVKFITKAEALATCGANSKDKTIVEQLHTNPLPASFEVKADDAANLTAIESAIMPRRRRQAHRSRRSSATLRPPAGPGARSSRSPAP